MTWTLIVIDKFGNYYSTVVHGPNSPNLAWEEAENKFMSTDIIYTLIGLIPGNHKMHTKPNYEKLQKEMKKTSEKILIEND